MSMQTETTSVGLVGAGVRFSLPPRPLCKLGARARNNRDDLGLAGHQRDVRNCGVLSAEVVCRAPTICSSQKVVM